MRKVIEGIIIGLSTMAIAASAKAFLDIEKLKSNSESLDKIIKANYKSQYDMIKEIHLDVREIRAHQLQE